ncbi:MAG: cytochrome c oxidase subunit 3 [Pseudomonadota bacterium]
MAGQKNHDYHIIEPSPWPMIAAIGAFTMLVGMVFWMHGGTIWIPVVGLGIVLYTMYAWWAEVVKESKAGDHTPVVKIGLRYGVILFIVSEVMFFVAWFWSYFKNAIFPFPSAEDMQAGALGGMGGVGEWPPVGVELIDPWHLPLLNTLILLTSGAACTWAHHAVIEGDRKSAVQGLLIAVILGAVFTAVQGYEYYEIVVAGLFAPADGSGGVYASNFFMATGFHGLHVIIGTIFLTVTLAFALRGDLSPRDHVSFEAAAWYWHFVDVVWLFLFAGIYVAAYYV